jgi:hypothetical protein
MFITLKLKESIPENTAVSYNPILLVWEIAQDTTKLIGVVKGDSYQDENGDWFAPVGISGLDYYMHADQSIPDEGGFLHIRSGRAYVDNSAQGCGTVAPINIGESSRVANDLVLIHLR